MRHSAVGDMFSEWRIWLSQSGVTEVFVKSISHRAGALADIELGLTLQFTHITSNPVYHIFLHTPAFEPILAGVTTPTASWAWRF